MLLNTTLVLESSAGVEPATTSATCVLALATPSVVTVALSAPTASPPEIVTSRCEASTTVTDCTVPEESVHQVRSCAAGGVEVGTGDRERCCVESQMAGSWP